MLFNNEISQENNSNATAHLYIQENGSLYKSYFDFNELTRKNIENLLAIAEDTRLRSIKELALPTEIIRENGRVVGYMMPYYRGRMMLDVISDEAVSFADKLSCFRQLASVLARMPEDVFVGDLHMKNVIVDGEGRIHLIDIDGFSVARANLLSCPLAPVIKRDARFASAKYQRNGEVIVSKNTDVLCFFDAFLYLILGNIYFTMYSQKCFEDYLRYLESASFPRALVDDVRTLFSDVPNKITVSALAELDAELAAACSFRAYARSLG